MTDALTALDEISESLSKLLGVLNETRSKRIAAEKVRPSARVIATAYFETVRPSLANLQIRAGLIGEIDFVMQALLALPTGAREKQAYRGQVSELRPFLMEATIEL